ncbi:Thioredoxin [Thermoactinomyces sp. DSM 45891]|uniref:thioredoxin family protein n=1 Tax=Thermoactinomyces sp. DSM 45891 TaxID=1761907 RepID=UPI000921BE7D|nr:thioredoxin family protein [Thermoactinomyces sp. DSM 45891]SFX71254.1 Thioredoxin [Thermoactinomyces sp. DSM 45891]
MSLQFWFEKGISFEEYVASMKANKEGLLTVYKGFSLNSEEMDFFSKLADQKLRIIGLTADWCGDAMLNVPIIEHIASACQSPLSLLNRDENLELMDQYLTNGTARAIPIFIWIDQEGNEKAVWGPRADEVQTIIANLRSSLPEKEDPTFAIKQAEVYRQFRTRLVIDQDLWLSVKSSVQACLSKLSA